jgi:predicted HTH transcriptional regulator
LRDTGASFLITLYRLDIEKVLAEEKAKAIDLVALGLNQRQQEAVEYVLEQGRITNREYRGLTGVSRRWATKEIREMVDLGILTVQGTGRAIHYVMMRD